MTALPPKHVAIISSRDLSCKQLCDDLVPVYCDSAQHLREPGTSDITVDHCGVPAAGYVGLHKLLVAFCEHRRRIWVSATEFRRFVRGFAHPLR